jgi:hypothetical protein
MKSLYAHPMQKPNIANAAVNLLLRWQLLNVSIMKVPAEHKTKRIQLRNIKHLDTIEYIKNSSLYIITVCLACTGHSRGVSAILED